MQIFYSLPGIFAVTPDSELTIALALTNWTIILTTGTFYQNNCLIASLVSSPVTRVVAARTLQRIPGNVGVFNAEELSSGAGSGEIVIFMIDCSRAHTLDQEPGTSPRGKSSRSHHSCQDCHHQTCHLSCSRMQTCSHARSGAEACSHSCRESSNKPICTDD